MYVFDSPAALVGVSELRTHWEEVLKLAKRVKVFLGKRQKPLAVLVPIEEYEEREELLDRVEEMVLGYEAWERDRKTKIKDYLPLEEARQQMLKK